MNTSSTHEKMISMYHLLSQDSISLGTFDHIQVILKGIHPDLDSKLDKCAKALHIASQLQSGDVFSLTAEHLPEKSEKDKKRKKAILFFISNIKNLQNEIQRVDTELSQSHSESETVWHMGRIIKFAKGPFGLITLAALIVVGVLLLARHTTTSRIINHTALPTGKTIEVITYNGKQIPLTQLFVGHGPDCSTAHYHAIGEATATALDGTILQDPGNCGFGQVKDMQITTVRQ